MAESGDRKRSRSKSNTYTVLQLARHWRLSYRDTVDRLCDPETKIPLFLKTTELHLQPSEKAGLPDLARVLPPRPLTTSHMPLPSPSNRIIPAGVEAILLATTRRQDPLTLVRVEGHARRIHVLLKTRRTFRKAMRVRVRDVEAYDKRPALEAEERARRARGGKAAAEKRHKKHVAKVKLYRDEYRTQLQARRREHPRETKAALSPKVIAAMAKAHGQPVKRMRDLIKPRKIQKDVH